MSRIKFEFDALSEYIRQLEQAGGAVKEAVEKGLVDTFDIVTKQAKSAIKPHRQTGITEDSLRQNPEILWKNDSAEVKVGFAINDGGLASIFLMYGTPRMQPDRKLYNAFYGAATKKKIMEAQENAIFDEFERAIAR